jgi:hypothetical protein
MELYWDTLYVRIIKERMVLSPMTVMPHETIYHNYNWNYNNGAGHL